MSTGSTGGIAGSAAGSPLAQTQGPGAERQDAAAGERRVAAAEKAKAAEGVAEPDGEDHQPEDRSADGRRPWENPPANSEPSNAGCDGSPRRSEDATGTRGNLLDLSG